MNFGMRITGHEIVKREETIGDETIEVEMLRVTAKGLGDDKIKFQFEVDPELVREWPMTERGDLSFTLPQQRLDLDGKNGAGETLITIQAPGREPITGTMSAVRSALDQIKAPV